MLQRDTDLALMILFKEAADSFQLPSEVSKYIYLLYITLQNIMLESIKFQQKNKMKVKYYLRDLLLVYST